MNEQILITANNVSAHQNLVAGQMDRIEWQLKS
jgi:hypothetical protein